MTLIIVALPLRITKYRKRKTTNRASWISPRLEKPSNRNSVTVVMFATTTYREKKRS